MHTESRAEPPAGALSDSEEGGRTVRTDGALPEPSESSSLSLSALELLQVPHLWDDGNIFFIGGKVGAAMKREGWSREDISAFYERLHKSPDYTAALRIVMEVAEEADAG